MPTSSHQEIQCHKNFSCLYNNIASPTDEDFLNFPKKNPVMNSISGWFCTSSSKKLFVKIVHPGGHVELHDRPILAAELLERNPKCCVAHPTVFQQPHAVVSPETILVLGQKYYVVPIGTIRKLQLRPSAIDRQHIGRRKDDDAGSSSVCWLFRNNKNDAKEKNGRNGGLPRRNLEIKIRATTSESSSDETKTESSRKRASCNDSSVGAGNGGSSSPGRISLVSMDNWQPGLESVTEE